MMTPEEENKLEDAVKSAERRARVAYERYLRFPNIATREEHVEARAYWMRTRHMWINANIKF